MKMSKCRSCGASIFWAKTENDRNMPLDPDRVREGTRFSIGEPGASGEIYCKSIPKGGTEPGYVSHFATCPNAQKHRSKK